MTPSQTALVKEMRQLSGLAYWQLMAIAKICKSREQALEAMSMTSHHRVYMRKVDKRKHLKRCRAMNIPFNKHGVPDFSTVIGRSYNNKTGEWT